MPISMTIKGNIIGLLGILAPGIVSVYSFLDKMKPVLSIIALVVSIAVGVTVFILNYRKIRENRRKSKS